MSPQTEEVVSPECNCCTGKSGFLEKQAVPDLETMDCFWVRSVEKNWIILQLSGVSPSCLAPADITQEDITRTVDRLDQTRVLRVLVQFGAQPGDAYIHCPVEALGGLTT